MVVSSFAIGVLGRTLFFTGFTDGCLTILFINLLGITPVSQIDVSDRQNLTLKRYASFRPLVLDSVFVK